MVIRFDRRKLLAAWITILVLLALDVGFMMIVVEVPKLRKTMSLNAAGYRHAYGLYPHCWKCTWLLLCLKITKPFVKVAAILLINIPGLTCLTWILHFKLFQLQEFSPRAVLSAITMGRVRWKFKRMVELGWGLR